MKIELINIFHKHVINNKQYYYLIGAEYGYRINKGEDIRITTGEYSGFVIKDFRFFNEDVGMCCEGRSFCSKLKANDDYDIIEHLEAYQDAIEENDPFVVSLEVQNGKFGLVKVLDRAIIKKILADDSDHYPKDFFEVEPVELKSIQYYYEEINKRVLGQSDQIKRLLGKIYSWQKDVNSGQSSEILRQIKPNIIVTGASGSGKTEIIKQIARMLNVPIIIEDANRYTAEGFYGQSVDDLLINLITKCNGDVQAAQNGIIVLDEFDKLNTNQREHDGVGTKAVQDALITMMEGGTYTVGKGRNSFEESYTINTTKIQFILLGSFETQMVAERTLGFGNKPNIHKSYVDLKSDDLIRMGMNPELIGRAPTIIGLNNLTVNDYKRIINESKISYLNIIKENYKKQGIKFIITAGFIDELAIKAAASRTGARSIRETIDELIGTIEYDIHAGNIKEVILDETLFRGRGQAMVKKAVR